MDLYADRIVIEVTRKCNMNCTHCLRGCSQRLSISNQHLYKFLDFFDVVGSVGIMGGEPTLEMEILHHLRNCIVYGNADVQNFFMVTNGKSINVSKVAEWANMMKACCSSNDMSSIGFSFDQWHTQELTTKQLQKRLGNFNQLQEVMEYEYGIIDTDVGDFIHKHSDESWGYSGLKKQGRAINMGGQDPTKYKFDMYETEDETQIQDNIIYLTCSGWIVADCNWSYRTMDNDSSVQVAHIDDVHCADDLARAIKEYNRMIERMETRQLQVA